MNKLKIKATLTQQEGTIFATLLEHKGDTVSRSFLQEELSIGGSKSFGSNHVDVHIKNLRRKLSDEPVVIETVRGVGYKIA